MNNSCSVCGTTESPWFSKGMCSNHYKQAVRRAKRKPSVCRVCSTPFEQSAAYYAAPRRPWCSDECRRKDERDSKRTRDPIPCLECSSVELDRRPDAKYCSNACSRKAKHRARLAAASTDICTVPGCLYEVGVYGNNGMCRAHSRRAQRAARPAHYRAMLDMRRRRVKQATPPWADLDAIYEFYLACPEGYEVDHIIPLVHPEVSGLHVLENLQYLPMLDNRVKGNRLPPGALDWVTAAPSTPASSIAPPTYPAAG